MAELTKNSFSPQSPVGFEVGSKFCKSELPPGSAGTSPPNLQAPVAHCERLIFVRYLDHVMYSRASALALKPQMREAIGWLVYECQEYVTLVYDRDADPPTLRGGDPKASGLVLLRSDIIALERLKVKPELSHEHKKRILNSANSTSKDELAFRPTERKTHRRE